MGSSANTTQQDNKITVANGGVFVRSVNAGGNVSLSFRDEASVQLAREIGKAGLDVAALGIETASKVATESRTSEQTLQRVLLAGAAVAALFILAPAFAKAAR